MVPSPDERASRGPVRLVRGARLAPAAASARHAGGRAARQPRAPGRGDGRGQDAGRVPADADRADRGAGRGAAHALYLAAQGAGGRRPAQPADPDRRDGAEHPRRDAHRRHPARTQGAPACATAADPADHARIAQPAAVLRGQFHDVRRAAHGGGGRGARLCQRQARRSAVALPRAAPDAGAGHAAGGAVGDGGRSRRLSRLDRAAWRYRYRRSGAGRAGRRSRYRDPAARGARPLVGPFGPLCRAAGDGGDRDAQDDDRVLQHPRPCRTDL